MCGRGSRNRCATSPFSHSAYPTRPHSRELPPDKKPTLESALVWSCMDRKSKIYALALGSARLQPGSGLVSLLCMQTVVASNLHPGGPTSRAPAFIETRSNSPIPQPHTLCPRVIKPNHICGNFLSAPASVRLCFCSQGTLLTITASNFSSRSWRDGSATESTDCSFRGSRFDFRHPNRSAEPQDTLVPKDPMPSSGLRRYCRYVVPVQPYKQTKHTLERGCRGKDEKCH